VTLDPACQVANQEQARLPYCHGGLGRRREHMCVRHERRNCMAWEWNVMEPRLTSINASGQGPRDAT
jgi:hypothetical protein